MPATPTSQIALDVVAHDLGRQLRLLEHGNIACARTDGGNLAFAVYSPITPDAYDTRGLENTLFPGRAPRHAPPFRVWLWSTKGSAIGPAARRRLPAT